ncbi:thiamine phosphate synthase [Dyadobacter sp. OTU695]|uniref:thiamine phosphate synthase n=1 Tax=Dyadobacter sp. OTU695 TaxID=3043860 RepID=UPI00313AB772
MKELIVITRPEMLAGEAGIINQLLAQGLARLHVRKPQSTEEELRSLLEQIDPQYRGRIALHQHHTLASEFGITGLHFTETGRLAQREETLEELKNNGFIISTSIHKPVDVEKLSHCFDYMFLGPVFDSISKKNYKGVLTDGFQLERFNFPGKLIALGGIDRTKLDLAASLGFDGVAVLGAIWRETANAVAEFRVLASALVASSGLKPGDEGIGATPRLKPGGEIDRLHFISNETGTMSHIDSIRLALEAGCRWIQLRIKNRPEEEVLPIAWEATRLCDSYGAKLIINDFPRIALAIDAYGLHLGLTDMPVPEARALVGAEMIIGGTANTWEDIARRVDEGADYVGLGPFRFTNTKQNLSPILGLEGYLPLMTQMREAGHTTPVIAIGGIIPEDIGKLRAAGVHGVAMSAALIGSADPQKTYHQIQEALC